MLIRMYQNPYTPGFAVLSKSGYSVDSSGSANYLATNDFPEYAAMFYSPTEHESITSIKYGNFEQDYSNLREIQESLNGPPIEFYIPHSFDVGDGVGRQDNTGITPETVKAKMMDKLYREAVNEIRKAQDQVKGKRIRVEFEDVLFLRRRKMTVVFEER